MLEKSESTRVVMLMLTWACNLNCVYCFENYKTKGKEMSFEMAKKVLTQEFEKFKESNPGERIKIEFFGGEPLLRFDLIRDITEWIENNDPGTEYLLSVTSNGTLLNDEMKDWFVAHKDKIRIVMSVDGSEDMQENNRGKLAGEVPLDFVRRVWPRLHFKSTISRSNLPSLAESLIPLLEKGHVIAPNLAVGEDWQPGDAAIYKRELEKLADWHLAHPDVEPMNIFSQAFYALLEPHCSRTPKKNCGTGTTMVIYDVDGRTYPCHLFVPITHGRECAYEDLSKINFYDDASFIDPDCMECKMLRICKTCYGFNYRDRGDVRKRDRRVCQMQLAEAQIISDFQINWFTALSKRRQLTEMELFALKGALKCHELYADYSIEYGGIRKAVNRVGVTFL